MTKVLVVDDEPEFGVYLRDWLSREGHEVRTALTAEEAIQFGASWQPNVLVADWMLQSPLDGLHVSEAVKAANPALQTILITGYPSPELKARALAARVFSFIEKPFSFTEVAGAVRKAANVGHPLFAGHVLIVAENALIGQTSCDAMNAAGYECRVALGASEARAIADRDPLLAIVVLDGVAPTTDMGILAHELSRMRPKLIVVGSSEGDDRRRFAELGVDHFLPRFWEPDNLHALLITRIESCTGCGLTLPLRKALPTEEPRRWECVMCGARYEAVLLADALDDARRHVREVGGPSSEI